MASATKRYIISQALNELGLFDIEPTRIQRALGRLDGLVAQWNAEGLRIGWPMTLSPDDAALDTETGVTDAALRALYLGLAVDLAPGLGKTVAQQTTIGAYNAKMALELHQATVPPIRVRPSTMPRGAGNTRPAGWRSAFYPGQTNNLEIGGEEP